MKVATGADTRSLPKNMATKLAKDGGYKAVYMQIHYNNPEGDTNATDSSGFTAYATSQPREHECAPLWPHSRSNSNESIQLQYECSTHVINFTDASYFVCAWPFDTFTGSS